MNEFLQFIETIGFPIFLSFYLLHRIEEKLTAIHHALLETNQK
ncbi:YvrJ family protein [Savagea faecisuis]|mgnify:FL=1|uniref:YvrJ family protein n=1 Tax=Savagea faecisuis TaxID=1274803 RepID=A0ABW3GWV5_9BACL